MTPRSLSIGRWLPCVIAAIGLAGCASAPPPPPEPVDLSIEVKADSTVNPDLDGRPSPLAVRVYLLTGPEAIADADLLALWQTESAALAGTLVERREYVLAPGASATAKLTVPEQVTSIAVAAAYRNFRDATWRVVLPVDAGASAKQRHLTLDVLASSQSVTADLQPASP
jgi:type VI secretion system protein VasD